MNENVIGKEAVDAAVKVHREPSPGLLETVYEVVLAKELERRGLRLERQVVVMVGAPQDVGHSGSVGRKPWRLGALA